ncbi:isoprenylcysteine carboxylmethyltransferase family protein [Agreia sp. PsM10]|uniref:methyltransferase family protein n=1 Tax=Agreia sp. PsM10 TaxID=3030533 RepID=UPI00263A9F85|nr:isoprenylcysteine carboxylmethyltransferase family protein [Agreia sp. PsM10]MDN4641014.1 isoprenylcysteine carboxylmethyltransferase family protein [Agreia sp. PsM10]
MLLGRAYFAVQAIAGAAWWIAVFTVPFVREATLGRLDPIVVAVFDIPLFVVASALAAFGIRAAAIVAAGWTVVVAAALAVYATVTTEAGWGVLIMAAAAAASIVGVLLQTTGRVPTEWIVRGPFAFRAAEDHSRRGAYAAATGGQIVVFWGLFLVVLPVIIAFLERRWGVGFGFAGFVPPAGVVVLVLASALGLSSAFVMSTRGHGTPLPSAMPNRLVIAGPYRWVRNPMAVAGVLQGVAAGLILSSWLVVAYAIVGSLLWNYAVRPSEEADLEARFGDDFVRYADDVRCWWPRVPHAE